MRYEEPAYRRRGRLPRGTPPELRWAVWTLAVVLGTFALGYVVTALVFFPSSDRPPVVAVPDLREMDEGRARHIVRSAGLELDVGDTLPNPEVQAGRILSQTPLPGQEVAPGAAVRVIVSGGAERRAIPVVTAMTREQALRVLEASGFRVQVEEVEDLRAAGRVVGIEPRPGIEMQVPATVRLLVSSGPPMVAVPDLYGLRHEDAVAALQAAGLEIGEIEYSFAGFRAEELVIGQDPAAGDSVPEGSAVNVRLSTDRIDRRRRW